jgi:adenylosuccinate synthase
MVLLRYATRINGMTDLALTKLDILTGLEPVKICTGYRKDGQAFNHLPLGPSELGGFEPVYEELPGWEKDLPM